MEKGTNLPPFGNSGDRFSGASENLPDIDTAGIQLAIMSKWWGHRGVKFNDVDRDTMAFAKAIAPQRRSKVLRKEIYTGRDS